MKNRKLYAAIATLYLASPAAHADETSVEHARYSVVTRDGDVEIRDYAPHVVAETRVAGERDAAINQGFKHVAGYIFGGNAPGQKIAMTAPVMQQSAGDAWAVRFVMPSEHTLATLPKPGDPNVRLNAVPKKRYAAVTFSGWASDADLEENKRKLLAHVSRQKLKARGAPVFAFYDPPWTLPFNRRNEVLVEVE